jgi:hypothetical protein
MPVNKYLFIVLPVLLLFSGIALADYTCQPTSITITINTLPTINVGQKITITASVNGNPSGNPVYGDIVGSLGVLQTVTGICDSNVCTFTFASLQTAGDYTVRIYTQHPATNTNVQSQKAFTVNPPLSITIVSSETIFYYGSDIKFRATITPDVCSNEFLLSKCTHLVELQFGTEKITVNANRKDIGGGLFDYTIASTEIPATQVQKGQQNMIIYLTVKDLSNRYGTTTSSLKSLSIIPATIVTNLDVPITSTVDTFPRIKLNFQIGGTPTDVDSFEMAITLPNGQIQIFQQSQFIHEQTGQYVLSSFKFTIPQSYKYEVRNIKLNQNGIVITGVPVTADTAVENPPGPTDCGNGICQADKGETTINCPGDCNPDVCGNGRCGADETAQNCPSDCKSSNWILYVIIGVVLAVIILVVVLKMKKR